MPRWVCPHYGCSIWALAPSVPPVHKIAPNPFFQAKDPHCPVHKMDLIWTPDVEETVTATEDTVTAVSGKTVDKKMGILVGHFNGTTPIYCDLHQRKHIYLGRWPGGTSTDKPVFRDGVFDQSNLALGILMAQTMPWGKLRGMGGGVDAIFDCGKSVVGTEGETDILLQGGFTSGGITFHAYPVEEDQKRKAAYNNARSNGFYLYLDIANIVNSL